MTPFRDVIAVVTGGLSRCPGAAAGVRKRGWTRRSRPSRSVRQRYGISASASRPDRRIRRVGNVETLLTERDCRAESRHVAPISREARTWQQSALTMKRLW